MGQEPLLASLKGEDVAAGRRLREVKRVLLDSAAGCYGCVVPKGAWHTVEVLAPSVRQKTENTAKTAANRGISLTESTSIRDNTQNSQPKSGLYTRNRLLRTII